MLSTQRMKPEKRKKKKRQNGSFMDLSLLALLVNIYRLLKNLKEDTEVYTYITPARAKFG